MALTADQTAVLELLLGGGQDFAELASLLDLDEAEIRSRARGALAELGGSDPDANVGLSEFLLGQSDRIGRADVLRHLRQDAGDHALAVNISQQLAQIAPEAELPELPPGPGGSGFLGRAGSKLDGAATAPAGPSLPTLDTNRSRVIAISAGAGVILVAIILAITGVFSSDEGPASSSTGDQAGTGDDAGATTASGEEVTRIPLAAIGNGDATGEGIVGITTGDQVYLDLSLQGLEAAPSGQVYVVWFLFDESRGYPLSPIAVGRDGSFSDRFAIPSVALDLISRSRFLEVSLAPIQQVRRTINQALEQEQLVIKRPGRSILIGEVPVPEGQEAPTLPEGAGNGAGNGRGN